MNTILIEVVMGLMLLVCFALPAAVSDIISRAQLTANNLNISYLTRHGFRD